MYFGILEDIRRVDLAFVDDVKMDFFFVVLVLKIVFGYLVFFVVFYVCIKNVDIFNFFFVNVTVKNIRAYNCVVYNVVDEFEEGFILFDGVVFMNVFIFVFIVDGEYIKFVMMFMMMICGGKVFKNKLT